MSTKGIKNKSKSFALTTSNNVTQIYATLSDRLKQAGIKENKPKCDGKRCKHKHCKRKRAQFKKSHATDHDASQTTKPKSLKHFAMPYLHNSIYQERHGEVLSKPSEENDSENLEDNERDTIYASLDFIEDFQNYKKKVRKPGDELLKTQKKTVRILSTNQKQSPSKSQVISNLSEDKKGGTGDRRDRSAEIDEKSKNMSDDAQDVRTSYNKPSSRDIAKIDRKYLQSILSFTNHLEEKSKRKAGLKDEWEVEMGETHPDTKQKLTGKDFFELKLKKEQHNDGLKQDSKIVVPEEKTEVADTLDSPNTDTRIVRDMAKSEEQVQLKKGKDLFENCKTKRMKTKIVTHSKSDVNDIDRKKRKRRNKFMKKNAQEHIETSPPSEVSKMADVTELWRRRTHLKKSENSLTSHSSCTVPENDDYPGRKNLESYRILKKLIEDEIQHICKKYDGKDNPEEATEAKSKEDKQVEPAKKPPQYGKKNELSILKRRLLQAEGELEKPKKLSFLAEDIPKEANSKLVSVEQKVKSGGELPSKIIENWSILNRLEQAFMGLGTPTFPEKNIKNTTGAKSHAGIKDAGKVLAERLKETHKNYKCKFLENAETKVHSNKTSSIQTQRNATKHGKKTENVIKPDPANKPKKNPKEEPSETAPKAPKTENTTKLPQKKPQNRTLTRKPFPKASHQNTDPPAGSEAKLDLCSPEKTKPHERRKKRQLNLEKTSGESLERKKTFNVIPEAPVEPRKSKSCGINDVNIERRLSESKNQETKLVSEDNIKDGEKSHGKNDTIVKIMLAIPKRMARQPTNSCGNRNVKNKEECMEVKSENVLWKNILNEEQIQEAEIKSMPERTVTSMSDNNESSKNDKKNTSAGLGIFTDSSSNHSNTVKDRVVKKRSILSVHVDQPCEHDSRTLQQINEKDPSANCPETNQQDFSIIHQEPKSSFSNISVMSTSAYDMSNNCSDPPTPRQGVNLEMSSSITLSSTKNSTLSIQESAAEELHQSRPRSQQLWEQDISHYRTIVKEIMSHYKRIEGFLKQNEQMTTLSSASGSFATVNSVDSSKSGLLNIHEYRRKIISEYMELPIFEYKSKLGGIREGKCLDVNRNRNLSVVKDDKADTDMDVKDYHPNVQTVLDSQLYVDTDKRIESSSRWKVKNSSLQDLALNKSEKVIEMKRQKSSSTLLQQRSYVVLQKTAPKDDNPLNFTNTTTDGYCQETDYEVYLPS